MKITDKMILDSIPDYPKACSEYLLALKLGYIKKDDSQKKIEKGLSRLEKRLAWITLRQKSIIESRAVIQKSTREQLSESGIEIKKTGEISYFSVTKRKERDESE